MKGKIILILILVMLFIGFKIDNKAYAETAYNVKIHREYDYANDGKHYVVDELFAVDVEFFCLYINGAIEFHKADGQSLGLKPCHYISLCDGITSTIDLQYDLGFPITSDPRLSNVIWSVNQIVFNSLDAGKNI